MNLFHHFGRKLPLSADHYLKADYVERYNYDKDYFVGLLVDLNTSFFAFKKLAYGHFDLFETRSMNLVWKIILESIYDRIIVNLHKFFNDTGNDVTNILKFKNEIAKNLKTKEILHLGLFQFPDPEKKHLDDLTEKLKDLRSRRVAHSIIRDSKIVFTIPIEKIEQLLSLAEKFLEPLLFSETHSLILNQYATENPTDVDDLLRLMITDSRYFNLLEENKTDPESLSIFLEPRDYDGSDSSDPEAKKRRIEETKAKVNDVRKKYGYDLLP